MPMHLHAALTTLLTVLLLVLAMFFVGRARGRHGIEVPATVGHPDFERAFRAHQNTVEQTVMFLPTLWVACLYGNERIAIWLGYAWLLGRLWYLFGYLAEAGKRSKGFLISTLANLGLLLLAGWGLLTALLHA
jgi:uncharacterized MAPEG superfamily protein